MARRGFSCCVSSRTRPRSGATTPRTSTGSDPGTGWCLALGSSHAWVVGSLFPEDVQAEAFGPDGDFRCPHPAAPTAEVTPVDGGYRITGKLPYASGIPYATWALGGALVP